MALGLNYKLNGDIYVKGIENLVLVKNCFDLSLDNAYVKIINFVGSKELVELKIGIYDKKDGALISTDHFEFTPDLSIDAKNFLTQGYEQLKANKYPDAVDLLDEGQIA